MAPPKPNQDERPDIGDALGMIETRGLIGMIEAADAMLKTANVVLVSWQKVDAGEIAAVAKLKDTAADGAPAAGAAQGASAGGIQPESETGRT